MRKGKPAVADAAAKKCAIAGHALQASQTEGRNTIGVPTWMLSAARPRKIAKLRRTGIFRATDLIRTAEFRDVAIETLPISQVAHGKRLTPALASRAGSCIAPIALPLSGHVVALWCLAGGLMGGDITVESEPGRGSAFTIRLPRIVDVPKEVVAANPAHTGEATPTHH